MRCLVICWMMLSGKWDSGDISRLKYVWQQQMDTAKKRHPTYRVYSNLIYAQHSQWPPQSFMISLKRQNINLSKQWFFDNMGI